MPTIPNLTALTGANSASGDLVIVSDVSATTTKKMTLSELFIGVPSTIDRGAAGALTIGNGVATSIVLGIATGVTGTMTITSAAAAALTVGRQGATTPALQVNAATASCVTGILVTSAAAAGGVAVAVTSSGTNENLTIDAKGSGTIALNATGTGGITTPRALTTQSGQATTAGGGAAGLLMGTGAFGLYFGSGAPSITAAKGSLYIRSDGSSSSTRLYVNTDGSTTWTSVTTAA